jgi:hypothetical protein
MLSTDSETTAAEIDAISELSVKCDSLTPGWRLSKTGWLLTRNCSQASPMIRAATVERALEAIHGTSVS